ncbi:MAG: dihydroxy-acid dehydratase, partial [Planctomycetaceae bacterium]
GDGRQSGTSASPSILNASPEAFAGGGLARLRTGDRVRVDLRVRRVDALVPEAEWLARDTSAWEHVPPGDTPWQALYRGHVGQLHTGACLEMACGFRDVCRTVPRHSH